MKQQAEKDVKRTETKEEADKASKKKEDLLKFKERPGFFRGARVRVR